MAEGKGRKERKSEVEPYRYSQRLAPFERMDELFDDFFQRPFSRSWWPGFRRMFHEMEPSPSVDIFEEGDNVVVKSELPGMSRDDIEINLTDDTVTISGEKKKEEKIDRKNFHRLERTYGSFSRSFSLPAEVQTDKARASFKNGLLEISIPKTEAERKKRKKIKIVEEK